MSTRTGFKPQTNPGRGDRGAPAPDGNRSNGSDPAALEISLCMIVRDEEPRIAHALQSALPHVDEVVVVDTGSRDRTPHIAHELGARVFTMPWPDSFSLARNESIRPSAPSALKCPLVSSG